MNISSLFCSVLQRYYNQNFADKKHLDGMGITTESHTHNIHPVSHTLASSSLYSLKSAQKRKILSSVAGCMEIRSELYFGDVYAILSFWFSYLHAGKRKRLLNSMRSDAYTQTGQFFWESQRYVTNYNVHYHKLNFIKSHHLRSHI